MLLAGKHIDRNLEKRGIRSVLCAIVERSPHRFDHVMPLFARTFHSQLRWKVLEDVQHLDQGGPAARRRRHRQDLVISISTFHGVAFYRAVIPKILVSNGPVVGGYTEIDQARRLTLVELPPAVFLNARNSGSKLG